MHADLSAAAHWAVRQDHPLIGALEHQRHTGVANTEIHDAQRLDANGQRGVSGMHLATSAIDT
jgi:hypothetical protein